METNNMTREITIKDLWNIFTRRFLLMVLAAVTAISGVFLVSSVAVEPRYTSTATLYILSQDDYDSLSYTSESFSLALKVVNDCNYLLKSHSVLDEVIAELDLDITYGDLYDSVSIKNPENTRILEVTAESDSPEQAKEIVDAICSIGPAKIREAMGFDQVNLYEYGILSTRPSNSLGLMAYMLIGVVAAVMVYAVFLLAFLLDDRIRTEEDVQKYLGLSILGVIPNANDTAKKGYGYKYRYGRRYGYGYGYGYGRPASRSRTTTNVEKAPAFSAKTDGKEMGK